MYMCGNISLILLIVRNASDKVCRENQNTFYVQYFFFLENRSVYEIMWKNIVEPDSPQGTIWHLRIACWIPKAVDTLSVCNTYCLSAATMVARTRLYAALIRT